MIQCSLCSHRAKSLGKLTAHRFKAHPEEARRSVADANRTATVKSKQPVAYLKGPSEEKRLLNGAAAPEMTKTQILDYLRGKRRVIDEIIADLERL